jgi:CRP/FNR family cyclic AMP-dependent transcriptional regulator
VDFLDFKDNFTMQNSLEGKRVFLIATDNVKNMEFYKNAIQVHISNSTVYIATDGSEALAKIENAPPNVVILDRNLTKLSGDRLKEIILEKKNLAGVSIIFVGGLPEEEVFLDDIVIGRLQFLLQQRDEVEFNICLTRALNFSSRADVTDFFLKFLAPNDKLLTQGDAADYVYILRRGTLRAFITNDKQDTDLGKIQPGEFVGEMSFINGAPRSANVVAETDCELIEIPINTFEKILYQKPSWAKALMLTLSNRINKSNQTRMKPV